MSDMIFHVRFLLMVSLAAVTTATPLFADRYVAQGGQTPDGAYTDWSSAASNVHEAVSAVTTAGETVWVSNGWYKTPSTITISQSMQLRAAEGSSEILIDGQGVRRVLHVSISQPMNVLIDGLTLTNGYTSFAGGGIQVDHSADVGATVTVHNCVITHCRGSDIAFGSKGGGIRIQGRSDSDGLFVHLDNCRILHNFAWSRAGGIKLIHTRFLMEECHVAYNQTSSWDPFADPPVQDNNFRWGGGIHVESAGPSSIIRDCTIEHNRVNAAGGGISVRNNGFLLERCIIRSNLAGMGGGVHVDSTLANGIDPMIVRNSLIHGNVTRTNAAISNTSFANGGGVRLGRYPQSFSDAVKDVWIQNSTIVSNYAAGRAGGLYTSGDGDQDTILLNTIAYGNVASQLPALSNVYFNTSGSSTYYVTNSLIGTGDPLVGSGNITDERPAFLDFDGANYRLTRTSPCVNAGYYQAWMDDACDLDGYPRVNSRTGDVDIGCYEYQSRGTLITVM